MKRTDIRWNLVFEFNRMNLVQDERTEQEAEKDRKISLVWTAALLVLLLWPLRDKGTSRGFAVVDLCAVQGAPVQHRPQGHRAQVHYGEPP